MLHLPPHQTHCFLLMLSTFVCLIVSLSRVVLFPCIMPLHTSHLLSFVCFFWGSSHLHTSLLVIFVLMTVLCLVVLASADLFSKVAITVLHSRLLSSPESLRGLGTSAEPQSLHSVFTDLQNTIRAQTSPSSLSQRTSATLSGTWRCFWVKTTMETEPMLYFLEKKTKS